VNYDPLTSFEPICELAGVPTVIVVNSASPYRTLADLVGAVRAKPSKLTMASVGPGTPYQFGPTSVSQPSYYLAKSVGSFRNGRTSEAPASCRPAGQDCRPYRTAPPPP
jgi:hypothetical protein